MQGRFGASMRGSASRLSHSFHGGYKYNHNHNNRMTSNFYHKYQHSTVGITSTTTTMTARMRMNNNNNSLINSSFCETPNCMVYSSIGLTSTMKDGTHLIGFGKNSSLAEGMYSVVNLSCVLVCLYCILI